MDPTGSRANPPAPRAFGLIVWLAAAFVALPIAGLLWRAPWTRAGAVLGSAEVRVALGVSIIVSAGATLLVLLLGLPIGWMLARRSFPGRRLLRGLVILPLVLPPVVGGVGLLAALGRRGLIGPALEVLGVRLPFSTAGAVVAAAFVAFPILVLAVEAGLRQVDPRLEQAAATLGAGPWAVLWRVTLPILRPQIVAGCLLSWARALGEFGATITFAGNLRGRTQTLTLLVYEWLQTDPEGAMLIALLLVLLSIAVILAVRQGFGGER